MWKTDTTPYSKVNFSKHLCTRLNWLENFPLADWIKVLTNSYKGKDCWGKESKYNKKTNREELLRRRDFFYNRTK